MPSYYGAQACWLANQQLLEAAAAQHTHTCVCVCVTLDTVAAQPGLEVVPVIISVISASGYDLLTFVLLDDVMMLL